MDIHNTDLKSLSIVVPCYNEEAPLPLFYKEVMNQIFSLMATGILEEWE
jgi:glycosyltransferase involved in cell wall biosynthesis